MRKSPRNDTSHLHESQFEPGSRSRVLKNLFHIMRKRKMDVIEAERCALAISALAGHFEKTNCFTAADICAIHKAWLGDVYEWAGQYRQVNVSKGDFSFAMAEHDSSGSPVGTFRFFVSFRLVRNLSDIMT
jgi:cell filamentation protein, protein adenylyltransferase